MFLPVYLFSAASTNLSSFKFDLCSWSGPSSIDLMQGLPTIVCIHFFYQYFLYRSCGRPVFCVSDGSSPYKMSFLRNFHRLPCAAFAKSTTTCVVLEWCACREGSSETGLNCSSLCLYMKSLGYPQTSLVKDVESSLLPGIGGSWFAILQQSAADAGVVYCHLCCCFPSLLSSSYSCMSCKSWRPPF